jgi:hypothetical protein
MRVFLPMNPFCSWNIKSRQGLLEIKPNNVDCTMIAELIGDVYDIYCLSGRKKQQYITTKSCYTDAENTCVEIATAIATLSYSRDKRRAENEPPTHQNPGTTMLCGYVSSGEI